jgi:hypothetical protein
MRNFNKNLLEQLAGANSDAEGDALPIEQQIKNPVLDPSMSVEQLMDQRDAPLFVQPSELQSTEVSDINTPSINKSNYMDAAQQEADSQSLPMSEAEQDFNYGKGVVESGQETPESFAAKFGDRAYQPATQDIATLEKAPMSPQEKMMAEYKAMQERDRKDLQDARSSDRNLKMGGAIGDALATYLNARGQMNVKAPGVQVQQGAGLGKIADMFATAPDVAADLKNKREDLLAQYKQLQTGKGAELAERKVKAYEDQVANSLNSKSPESFAQKETIKANIKDDILVERENRKLKKELEPAMQTVDDQIKNVKDAMSLIKDSDFADTGPLDQYVSWMSPKGQLLKKALGNISLDTLVNKFQGMSRAIDTETDRKFFQDTQPNMSNFGSTNKKMLSDILTRLENVKAKSEAKLEEINSFKPSNTSQDLSSSNMDQSNNQFEQKVQKAMEKNPQYSREEIISALKKGK